MHTRGQVSVTPCGNGAVPSPIWSHLAESQTELGPFRIVQAFHVWWPERGDGCHSGEATRRIVRFR